MRPAAAFLLVWLCLVLLVTLSPVRAADGPPTDCLLCGERAIADWVLNVVLFVPAGLALRRLGMRPLVIFLAGASVSGGIEFAQLFLAGRYATPMDVAANGLGALVGGQMGARRPPAGAVAAAWGLAVFLGVVLLTSWLAAPLAPRDDLYAQWHPVVDGVEHTGEVLSATVGDLPLPEGLLADAEALDARMRAGEALALRFRAGPRTSDSAPIFALAEPRGPTHLLSARGDDLRYHPTTRAAALRLDRPFLVVPGALRGVGPGDTVSVRIRASGERLDVSVRSPAGDATTSFAPSAASGWTFLFAGPLRTPSGGRIADLLWVLGLTLALGLLAGGRGRALLVGALAGGLLLAAPSFTALASASLEAAALAVMGVLAGDLIGGWWGRLGPPVPGATGRSRDLWPSPPGV
jgi:hypothetical protein